MKAVFRVDANSSVGAGHFTRCSLLARALEKRGIETLFISAKDGHLSLPHAPVLNQRLIGPDENESVAILKELKGPISLVVDSYEMDHSHETAFRPCVKKILVWDDLANRQHDCDFLVDSSPARVEDDYRTLVPPNCKLLLGSDFCPLSEELIHSKRGDGSFDVLHLFFGSGASADELFDYYDLLKVQLPQLSLRLAYGRPLTEEQGQRWLRIRKEGGDELFIQRPLSESLSGCGIALGSPGIATWERAYLGVIGFYIATVSGHEGILRALEKKKICRFIGALEDGPGTNLRKFEIALKETDLREYQNNGLGLIDGKGLHRIAEVIIGTN